MVESVLEIEFSGKVYKFTIVNLDRYVIKIFLDKEVNLV